MSNDNLISNEILSNKGSLSENNEDSTPSETTSPDTEIINVNNTPVHQSDSGFVEDDNESSIGSDFDED